MYIIVLSVVKRLQFCLHCKLFMPIWIIFTIVLLCIDVITPPCWGYKPLLCMRVWSATGTFLTTAFTRNPIDPQGRAPWDYDVICIRSIWWWCQSYHICWRKLVTHRVRAIRALTLFMSVPLRTRRVLSPWTLYSDSPLLNETSIDSVNALLGLNCCNDKYVNTSEHCQFQCWVVLPIVSASITK